MTSFALRCLTGGKEFIVSFSSSNLWYSGLHLLCCFLDSSGDNPTNKLGFSGTPYFSPSEKSWKARSRSRWFSIAQGEDSLAYRCKKWANSTKGRWNFYNVLRNQCHLQSQNNGVWRILVFYFFFNSSESWFKLVLLLIFIVTKIIFPSEIWYCKVQYADRSECNDKVGVQNTGLAPWSYKESGKSAETSQLKYLIRFV